MAKLYVYVVYVCCIMRPYSLSCCVSRQCVRKRLCGFSGWTLEEGLDRWENNLNNRKTWGNSRETWETWETFIYVARSSGLVVLLATRIKMGQNRGWQGQRHGRYLLHKTMCQSRCAFRKVNVQIVFKIFQGAGVTGFLRGGGNWGTLRIPREDWGTLGKIRGITKSFETIN